MRPPFRDQANESTPERYTDTGSANPARVPTPITCSALPEPSTVVTTLVLVTYLQMRQPPKSVISAKASSEDKTMPDGPLNSTAVLAPSSHRRHPQVPSRSMGPNDRTQHTGERRRNPRRKSRQTIAGHTQRRARNITTPGAQDRIISRNPDNHTQPLRPDTRPQESTKDDNSIT